MLQSSDDESGNSSLPDDTWGDYTTHGSTLELPAELLTGCTVVECNAVDRAATVRDVSLPASPCLRTLSHTVLQVQV